MIENILLQEWDRPPFDKIKISDYEPAIATAISEAREGVEAIATNPETPTFENTIEALETVDRRLERINAILLNLNECCTSDEMQQVVLRTEPEVTRLANDVVTDRRIFERVEKVRNAKPRLNVEQRTLLENTCKAFIRHGVALEGEKRERYLSNELELSELKLRFGQNALADMNDWTLHLTDENDLSGLPDSVRAAAREEASARDLDGWLFTLSYPSYGPFMTYSDRSDLREKMYRAYASIGNRGSEHDNNAVIKRIAEIRTEQAHLLGYDTYCDYVLEDRMVESLPNLKSFMSDLWTNVSGPAADELADVQKLASQDASYKGQDDGSMMPWDFSYYAEKLKQQRYSFDSEMLRPYFPLDAVREGIFGLYGRLYGLRFEEVKEVPVYHEDVRVYNVTSVDDDTHEATYLGLLYLDMHPRPSKRSGAWMTEFRGQYGDVRPQIQVVCNFSKPTADAPSLLRFGEVETFMHEMGHAMHGMLSQVQYESLSGTNVKRDFVEMPSQVMENWCYEPEFLATFARHYKTGEPLPTEYIDKIRAAQNHMAAWLCLRQLNLGYTDIAFHTNMYAEVPDNDPFRAEKVEAAAMTNLLKRVPGCCTATNFSHIFGGGYASGYYGYKWAEVLDADVFGRFKLKGIFDKECAAKFRREVLSRGGTEHPAVLFRRFMGRKPNSKALLKRMNIIPGTKPVNH